MFEGLLQPAHLIVIIGIALLVFGPKKLPELGKGLGEGIRGFKAAIAPAEEKGKYAYVSNNLSASISSYSVAFGGTVTPVSPVAASASGPNDLATAQEGNFLSFLYVVEAGSSTVGAFHVNLANGSLTPLTGSGGLPAFSQGLAAYWAGSIAPVQSQLVPDSRASG